MKKLYLLFLLTILAMVAYSQTSKTINVATAGTLPSLISDDEKYTIEELTLTGNLNGTDFRLLRDMAGNNYQGVKTEGKLKILDLSGASIVAGGDMFMDTDILSSEDHTLGGGFRFYIEKDNVWPNYIVSLCKFEKIILPNNLTEIEFWAFRDCTSLEEIFIPNSVVKINDLNGGENPFQSCSKLKKITVGDDNENYTSIGGVLFDKSLSKIICYPSGKSDESYVVPNSVKEIDGVAFTKCKAMSIVIPEGIERLKSRTFYASENLETISLPNSLTVIDDYCFNGCKSLKNITLPNKLQTISNGAFWGSSSITSLVIPATVESIAIDAFRQCNSLMSISVEAGNHVYDSRNNCNAIIEKESNRLMVGCSSTLIPNDVLHIGDNSFNGNLGLTSITIPSSVLSIGSFAFSECRNLASIELPNSINVIGEHAFSFTALTSAIIPDNVTCISDYTFGSCTKLERVKMPENLSEIHADAFNSCWKLTSIEIPSGVSIIGERAFYACKGLLTIISNIKEPFAINENVFALSNGFSNATLYVPEGSVGLYEALEPWNKFKKIVAMEPYVEPSTMQETPLTFEAVEGTVQVSFFNRWASASFPIKYRIDEGPWIEGVIREDGTWTTSRFVGKKLQFIAKFMSGGSSDYVQVSCDNDCYVYGNILSMTNGEDFAKTTESGTCGSLFNGNTHIKNHPTKGLVLLATSLSNRCYKRLFAGCTSLTAAPELPATILAKECYQEMFKGCSNLNEVVCKAVDISAEGCTTNWLDGVSATGTFYKDATMTDWTEGVNGIPTGWTVKDFNTKVEKDDVVYTPNNEDHTVTVSDGGESTAEIVIQSSISINGQSYEVTAIGDCAFQNNELVVKVTIPETIASIGAKAFAGCKNLKSISIYVKTPINLSGAAASRTRGDGGTSVFSGVDTETCVLYVPAGSADAYRSADGWKEFTNIVEMASSIGIKVA